MWGVDTSARTLKLELENDLKNEPLEVPALEATPAATRTASPVPLQVRTRAGFGCVRGSSCRRFAATTDVRVRSDGTKARARARTHTRGGAIRNPFP